MPVLVDLVTRAIRVLLAGSYGRAHNHMNTLMNVFSRIQRFYAIISKVDGSVKDSLTLQDNHGSWCP